MRVIASQENVVYPVSVEVERGADLEVVEIPLPDRAIASTRIQPLKSDIYLKICKIFEA